MAAPHGPGAGLERTGPPPGRTGARGALLALVTTWAALAACAAPPGAGAFALRSADPERARVRYEDGQVSANDSCMVRVARGVSPGMPPLYVNGRPVGFC